MDFIGAHLLHSSCEQHSVHRAKQEEGHYEPAVAKKAHGLLGCTECGQQVMGGCPLPLFFP